MVLYISILAIGPLLRKMRPRALQGLDMARRARLGKVNCRYASPPRLAMIDQQPPSAACGAADLRQVATSAHLSASMNWAQRRYRLRKLCSLDFASVKSMTQPGRRSPSHS